LNFTDGHKKEETEPAGFNSATPKPAPLLGDLRTQAHRFIANHQIEILGAFLAFLFLCALTYGVIRWKYPWVFSIRHRVREGDASLRRERVRMERLVARRGAAESVDQVIRMLEKGTHSEAVTQLKEWQDAYLRLRFGLKNGKMARSSEIANLRKQYGAIKRKLSQTG
jgi:ribosomal protein L29